MRRKSVAADNAISLIMLFLFSEENLFSSEKLFSQNYFLRSHRGNTEILFTPDLSSKYI